MNEIWLSGIGILLALCGMTLLIFRRVSPIIVGPLAALLVTVLSGLPVLQSVTEVYVQGVGSFFVSYFMIFLLGNLLGSLYQISGAAAKIGETVVRWFGAKNCMVACLISAALLSYGAKNCMVACLISAALLSYGGINSFVIIFAIYPIALKLFEEADLPTYLLPGIVCGGMWTFAMTGPFSPQICNIVSMQSLGTPSYAGLLPGLAASVAMAVLIIWYMNRQAKKAKLRGEHFTPPEGGVRMHEGAAPNAVISFIPLAAVIVLFNVTNIGIVACLLIGIVLSLVLFCRSIPWKELLPTANQAATTSVTVIINTATIVGFGAVAKITPFYAWAVDMLEASTANPYVVAAVGSNLFACILGSSSGGLTLMYTSLKDIFLSYAGQGYSLEFIHRLCSLGSGGLDSMPWNGSIVSVFGICHTTHKASYKYNFVTCAVIPVLCTFLIALPICIWLG